MKKSGKIAISVVGVVLVLVLGYLLIWQFDVFGFFKEYRAVPVLTLKGETSMSVDYAKPYKEPGFTAEISGEDASDLVQINNKPNTKVLGKYTVNYSLTNRKGKNEVTATRTVTVVDRVKPVITLKGEAETKIMVGAKYEDAGAVAKDNADGNITNKVLVDNKVDTSKAGKYTVTYSVKDSSSNTATKVRTVYVYEITSGKTVYLTFDDGPSDNTIKILDLLKKYNAHATFFIVGNSLNAYKDVVKRMLAEGNAIAVHTNTHDYARIYRSTEAFWTDNEALRSKLKSITGVTCDLMRFPGGASNTVSANYCKGIMSSLVSQTSSHGYEFFDWNISSGDASGYLLSADELYKNIITGIHQNYETPVVLMHDSSAKTTTPVALERVLKEATAQGYVFKKLDSSVTPVHHGVNN